MNKRGKLWWNMKYGKDKLCAITKCRLRPGKNKDGKSKSVFLKCGHGFNRWAIQTWSQNNNTCPQCRTTFLKSLLD